MIRKGDILIYEVDRNSFISRMVARVTKSNYTHVAIALGPETLVESNSFIKTRVANIDYTRKFEVLRLVEDYDDEIIDNVIQNALNKLGTSYDYLRIFGLALKHLCNFRWSHLFNLKGSYVCTELIDYSFREEGITLLPEYMDGDIVPSDFLRSKALSVVT